MQQYNVSEGRDEAATAGVYLEETVKALGLYTTFGIRQDVASAFGSQVKKAPPSYPKFDFSYPVSDQSFFPQQPWISVLRLRLAYGQSGNQASQTAVLNNYTLSQAVFPGAQSATGAIVVSQLGNANLKPERGIEWEGGFDGSFLDNERVHLEVTMYRKFTRDAIQSFSLAPSYGVTSLSQYVNIGDVQNRGLEWTLATKILDTRTISWDVSILGTRNSNKLVHKSPTLNVNGPSNTSLQEGYPVFGFWGSLVESYNDLNGDHILAPSEIKFSSPVFLGAPYPRGAYTYVSSVGLWNNAVRVSANIHQEVGKSTQLFVGGLYYGTGNFYPRAAVDRTAPLAQQAAYIQAALNNAAYLTTASSIRLNELSISYNVPPALTRKTLHASSLAIVVAGRNLGLWSSYAGKDPNVDTSGSLGEANEDNALGIPPTRDWTLRFNLGL